MREKGHGCMRSTRTRERQHVVRLLTKARSRGKPRLTREAGSFSFTKENGHDKRAGAAVNAKRENFARHVHAESLWKQKGSE